MTRIADVRAYCALQRVLGIKNLGDEMKDILKMLEKNGELH